MEAVRQSWTDDRMDDLSGKVDELGRRMENGFNRVDADIRALRDETKREFAAVRGSTKDEFAAVRDEMREGFEAVDKRFEAVDKRFDKIDERFERFNEQLHDFYGVLVRTCIFSVGLLGVLVTVIGIKA